VVVEKAENALRLSALDRKASALGLSIGQPLADARAMLPELKVMAANEPADLKLLERIADWCERFTPYVALQPPRSLLLDVTGVAHLFGGEEALIDTIRERLRKQGLIVRGALAGTSLAARALARYRDGTVAPPGEDGRAIAPLPVEALDFDPETTHALRHAGLKTIGQVASRKRAELTARFGAGFVFALDAAFGRAEKPVSPRNPLPDYRTERNFAEPVTSEEIIRATLKSLAGALAQVLEKNGEGARRLGAVFFRADGAVARLAIETGAPTRDSAMIERLFREKLKSLADPLDPGFGFDLIRLSAGRTQKSESIAAELDADANAQKEIRYLIDRLAARFGAHRILAFRPNDTHIPEAAWMAQPAQYAEDSKIEWKRIRREKESPRRPLRFFAKAEPAAMLPSHLRWRSVARALAAREGPERIAMEWWRHQAPARDYYCAEDDEGRRYWLYRSASDLPQWFVQGLFA